jgi:hypothetical protein
MGEHMGEQSGKNAVTKDALTIVQAAAQLGVKTATVRMRWKRGKLKGFKKDGRIYVYLNNQVNKQGEQTEQEGEQVKRFDDATIELQSIELTRLLRENGRLNERLERMDERIDGLLASHAQERDREQVLRQQMQNQFDALAERLALPAPDTAVKARLDESEQSLGMLKSGIMQLLRFLEGKKA